MEVLGKILLTILYLGVAGWLSYWTWTHQLDFKQTFKNVFSKIKTPVESFVQDPSMGVLATRDPSKLYLFNGQEAGNIVGDVVDKGGGVFFFPRITNAKMTEGNALLPTFEVVWKNKKLALINANYMFSFFELPSGDKNVLVNADFKEIP